MDNPKVNDGKGFYDNLGLIDTLIEDCNELPHDLINGHYVRFCSRVVNMVQKLANLKNGIESDMKSMSDQLSELKALNEELANQNLPEDKGGD